MTKDTPMVTESELVVDRQRRDWDSYVASISGSGMEARKRRLTDFLGGFNGAYNWTRCTPSGDLRAILAESGGDQ